MKVLRRERGRRVRIPTPANPVIFREPGGLAPRSAHSTSRRLPRPRRLRRPAPAWVRWVGRNLETLLWFSVLGALGLSLWFSPRTQLQTLRVVGAPPSVQAELSRAIKQLGERTLTPRALEQRLLQYPWVEQVRWRGVRPGVAELHLQPRRGVVMVYGPQSVKCYVDATGFVFAPPNDIPQQPSGAIRVLEIQKMPSEGPIRSGEMLRAFSIVRTLAEDPRVRYLQIDLYPDGGQVLHLQRASPGRESLQVRLGDALQWPGQVAFIKRLLDVPADELRQWLYVDLKSPQAPALRMRTDSRGETP